MSSQEIEIFIVIKEGLQFYYLLKLIKRGFDVYCIPPGLGMHYSLHESGESHFRSELETPMPREEPPIALIMGEAGIPFKKGIIRSSLCDLGRASGICTAIFSISILSEDFRKFEKNIKKCFIIDSELLPKNTSAIEVGIWAVPERNKVSFEFNNPDIPDYYLFKITHCEPQIWIYARPY